MNVQQHTYRLSAESPGEVVVITCTGATAEIITELTEAFTNCRIAVTGRKLIQAGQS